MAIVGDTGSGKTYLENRLLKLRGHVIFLRTKKEDPDDDPMDRDWRRVSRVSEIHIRHPYWLLDPPYHEQRIEALRMFARARREGNWTLAIDELVSAQHAGLEHAIIEFYSQGRGGGITMVSGIQRPTTGSPLMRWVLSQSTHTFVFQLEGRDATEIIAKSVSARLAKEALPRLNWYKHQFAYYHRREKRIIISDAQHVERFM